MSAKNFGRKSAAIGATVLAGGALAIAGGSPAVAAPTCGATEPAATVVAPGVCQVVVTKSGTFTAPTGLSKLSALVVGAGGGARHNSGFAYGAGSGQVVYVDSVSLAGPAEVTVGRGGASSFESMAEPATGGTTELNGTEAVGGSYLVSGNGFDSGARGLVNSGGGATGDGQSSFGQGVFVAGGPGVVPSAVTGVDETLFPVIAGEGAISLGGDASNLDGFARPAGLGGGGSTTATEALAGGDGGVIFRYAAFDDGVPQTEPAGNVQADAAPVTKPSLAETGFESAGLTAGAFGAALIGGAALLVGRRRAKRASN